jgi:hypothetical protein
VNVDEDARVGGAVGTRELHAGGVGRAATSDSELVARSVESRTNELGLRVSYSYVLTEHRQRRRQREER